MQVFVKASCAASPNDLLLDFQWGAFLLAFSSEIESHSEEFKRIFLHWTREAPEQHHELFFIVIPDSDGGGI